MNLSKSSSLPVIALLILLSTGCRKLDVQVESQYTSANFPVSASDSVAAIGSLYTQLAGSTGPNRYAVEYWRMQELSTEEAIIPARDGNFDDGGQYRFLHKHTWTPDHPNVLGNWQWGFGAINNCNKLLNMFAPASNPSANPAAVAEIKAMRALFYFFMMDLFGNVPLINAYPVPASPATVPRAQVFQFIETDLKAALPNLTTLTGAATYGHATKWMALALLEKMYLNAEYYTGTPRYADAVAVADSILANGPYSLDANYGSVFAPTNGPQIKETVFAVPYDANLIPGDHFTRFGLSPYLKFKYNIPFNASIAMSTLPEFYANFNLPGDIRDTFWVRGKQFYFNGSPVIYPTTAKTLDNTYTGTDYPINWQVEFTDTLKLRDDPAKMDVGNDIKGQCEGIRSVKFYPDPNANPSTRYQGNDVPVFRLADVILMKAEALLRGGVLSTTVKGEVQTPTVLVNKIRIRVNAQLATSPITLDSLLPERAREFAWEGWRRNDLIRFGRFEDAWGFKAANPSETFRRIYPIPTTERALNPNLVQNPQY